MFHNKNKYWYIKERHNPQFKKPYYILLGNISAKDAKACENTLYGYNIVHRFETYELYKQGIRKFGIKITTISAA